MSRGNGECMCSEKEIADRVIEIVLNKLKDKEKSMSTISGSLPLPKDHICFKDGHAMYEMHKHTNHQSEFSTHKCTRCGYEEDYQYDHPR